jgi:recombinational DNA repair protein (RecF pathway)
MPVAHDQGVCIRHWDFSETSQTVSLFGRGLGLVRGLAKGARRERGAFDGGIDLLSRGEFGAIVKPGKELATLTEWDLLEVFPRLRMDLPANRAAFYMADLVGRMLAPEDPHPALFDRFVASLRTLGSARDPGEPPPDGAGALLAFQWTLLCETGHRPNVDIDVPAADVVLAYQPDAGTFMASADAAGAWKVRGATVRALQAQDAGATTSGPVDSIERANRFLAACVRQVIGTEPPTMHAVFGARGMPPAQPAAGAPGETSARSVGRNG